MTSVLVAVLLVGALVGMVAALAHAEDDIGGAG